MARIAVIIFLISLSGCATVTRGSSEAFVIETDPAGAEATLSSGQRCTTPCSLELKRKKEFVVKIEKDGFEPVEANVTSQVAGAGAAGMAGNVVLGGLIGAAVDVGTGATKELKPNPLVVKLVKLAPEEDVYLADASTSPKKIAFVTDTSPEYFYQPDEADPAGTIRMVMPPPSVERKGIKKVAIVSVDGAMMPPGTDRSFRIAPGTYEVGFARSIDSESVKILEFDVEDATSYSVGWREKGDDWEPVVYEIKAD